MQYAYVVRQPTDHADFSQWYCIKYIDVTRMARGATARRNLQCRLSDADPPVLRARGAGHFVWDYSNKPMTTKGFHQAYPHIRLKPGEGPILVDLDDVSTERTSKHPED